MNYTSFVDDPAEDYWETQKVLNSKKARGGQQKDEITPWATQDMKFNLFNQTKDRFDGIIKDVDEFMTTDR